MPRRDREYDDSPPSAKGGVPLWLILVLGGVGVCVLLCGGVGALAYVMYKRDVARQEVLAEQDKVVAVERQAVLRLEAERNERNAQEMARTKALARHRASMVNYRRDDFRSRVLGKTEEEVRDLVGDALPDADGAPDDAQLREPTRTRLVYLARTYKTDPQVLDREAVVVFRDGRATDVLFE